jgi:predicted porin
MLRKNAIVLALTTSALVPMTAMAADGLYGFVNVGLESASVDGVGAGNEVFASGPDGSLHAQDVVETRFGFKGSKELKNGMTAGYRLEFGLGTSDFPVPGREGSPNEDTSPTTRLAQVSLSGDFGKITAGNQWGILYEYLGWNVFRADGHGGGTWYYTTKNINNDAFGLRVSNALTYTYGGGGYSSDPFTFSVQVMNDPDTVTNDETFDAMVFAGAMTMGKLTLNAVSYNEADGSGAPEPSLIGFGARFNLSDATYVGGNYMTVDNDTGGDISSMNVLLTHDMGDGYSGMVSFGTGDGDNAIADLDSNLFLQFSKDYGQGVTAYLEAETAELEGGNKTSVIAVALKYDF